MTRITARASFAHIPAWAPPLTAQFTRTPFIAEIQAAVARFYDLPLIEMRSARRARKVARPRQVAMYLAKRLTKNSLPAIGRKFGGRDHSTVDYGIRVVTARRLTDANLDADIRAIEAAL